MINNSIINNCAAYTVLRPRFDRNKVMEALIEQTPTMNGQVLVYNVNDPTAQLVLPYVLTDANKILRKLDQESGVAVIYNTAMGLNDTEQEVQKLIAIFEAGWCIGDTFDDFTLLPARAYSAWITDLLKGRYRLDLEEEDKTRMACTIAWYMQSHNRIDVGDFITYCCRSLGFNRDYIMKFLDANIIHSDIDGDDFTVNHLIGWYVDEVATTPGSKNGLPILKALTMLLTAVSPRMADLIKQAGVNLLILTVTNSWQGANRSSITTAALEVRSVFLAMLYSAINNKRIRGTTFTKIVERAVRQTGSSDLPDTFSRRVGLYIADVNVGTPAPTNSF